MSPGLLTFVRHMRCKHLTWCRCRDCCGWHIKSSLNWLSAIWHPGRSALKAGVWGFVRWFVSVLTCSATGSFFSCSCNCFIIILCNMTLLDPEKMLHNPWADILWVKPLLSCSPCLLILLVWVCFSLYCFLVFSLEISHPASLASRLVTMLFSPPHLDTFLSLSSCGAASSCLFLTSAQAHFSFFALLFLGLFVCLFFHSKSKWCLKSHPSKSVRLWMFV